MTQPPDDKTDRANNEHKHSLALAAAMQRPIVAGLIAALTSLLVMIACILWLQASQQSDRETDQTLQSSWLLRSAYELYGSWEQVTESLAASDLFQKQLWIWSATGDLVYPKAQSIASIPTHIQQQPLLLHGKYIGSYAHTLGSQQSKLLLLSPFGALLLIGSIIIGSLVFGLLRRQQAAHTIALSHLNTQLSKLSPHGSGSRLAPDSIRSIDALDQVIAEVGERIFKLETLRKSMVADIAHELRTPLTVLRSKLDNALFDNEPIAERDVLLLQDEVYRMSQLLGDLQQLALAESGHLKLNPQWFSPADLINQLGDLLQTAAEDANVKLHCDLATKNLLFADEDRMKQVLINLIGNALRYARQEVRVTLTYEGQLCSIDISDDGIGIEEEELPHLFDRFYRGAAKSSHTANHTPKASEKSTAAPGLGLGLSIAKGLIEAHQGTINVSSKWGQGTVFHITLPIFRELNQQA